MPPLGLQPRRPAFRDARRFVIAVEGEKTEPWYLNGLTEHEHIQQPRRISVHVLPAVDGKSAPNHVTDRLARFQTDANLVSGLDECWVVIDRDSWKEAAIVTLLNDADAAGWSTCISNPCFEVWLLLHFDAAPAPTISKKAKVHWNELRSHHTSGGWPFTQDNIQLAITRATETDDRSSHPQDPPSTQVHRLIRELIA